MAGLNDQYTTPLTKLRGGYPRPYRGFPVSLVVKNGCFNASDGVILLSGLSVKHLSRRSTKWFRSLDSTSFIPPDAAKRRVRRSRVGLTTARVLTVVCIPVSLYVPNKKICGYDNDAVKESRTRGVQSGIIIEILIGGCVENVSSTPSDLG